MTLVVVSLLSSVRMSVVVQSVAASATVHGHHHRRLPRRQGDAATGHHRPTRACPGQPGHPQGVWWVGLGREWPWWAVGGDRRCSQSMWASVASGSAVGGKALFSHRGG